MADISTWSKVASNNAETSPDGAQAGWTGSQVGPWARETMAAMRRFYDAQEWSSILEDEAPRGDKTVTYASASTFTIGSVSNGADSAGYTLTDKLPAGQRIRLRQAGGTSVDYFITSTNLVSTTLTVTVSGNAVANVGYAANGMDVFMTGMTVLSPSTWGGAGNSTARDAQFTAVPATGTTWYDTDTNALQVSDGTAWVDPLLFREAGVDKAKVYYDDTNDRLVLEDGDWSSGVGVHGRIYINDVDGKLYHQTKDTATEATALSLTPGPDQGLEAEFLGGGIQNASYVSAADVTGGTGPALTQYVEKVFACQLVASGRGTGVLHGADILPKLYIGTQRYTGAGANGWVTGDEFPITKGLVNGSGWWGSDIWVSSTHCGIVSGNILTRTPLAIRGDTGDAQVINTTALRSVWEYVIRMWW